MRAQVAVRDDQMPVLLMIVLDWLAVMFRGNDAAHEQAKPAGEPRKA